MGFLKKLFGLDKKKNVEKKEENVETHEFDDAEPNEKQPQKVEKDVAFEFSGDTFEEEPKKTYTKKELEDMTVSVLKDIAKKNDLSGYSYLKKAELIDFLLENL